MKSRIFKVKKNETVKHTNKLGTILLFVLGLSITQFQCQNTLKINPNFSQVEFDKMADEVSNGKVLDISAKMFKWKRNHISFLIAERKMNMK